MHHVMDSIFTATSLYAFILLGPERSSPRAGLVPVPLSCLTAGLDLICSCQKLGVQGLQLVILCLRLKGFSQDRKEWKSVKHTFTHTYNIHPHTYIYTFIHIYIHIHTYILTYLLTYLHTYILKFLHTDMLTCWHTYIQSYITNTYVCVLFCTPTAIPRDMLPSKYCFDFNLPFHGRTCGPALPWGSWCCLRPRKQKPSPVPASAIQCSLGQRASDWCGPFFLQTCCWMLTPWVMMKGGKPMRTACLPPS